METIPEISDWSITNLDILLLAGAFVLTLLAGYGFYRLSLSSWIRREKYPKDLRYAVIAFMVFFALLLVNIPGWPLFDSFREIYQWLIWVLYGLTIGTFLFFVVLLMAGLREKRA
jgi:hypothetical protein